MWNVTTVGMILGSLLIVAAIIIAVRRNDFPKNAYTFVGIGAFLIAGSQWNNIKVTKDGIEFVKEQIKQTSNAVGVTQTQLAELSSQLEAKDILSRGATRVIYQRLAAAPPSDSYTLNPAFAVMRTAADTTMAMDTTAPPTSKVRRPFAAKKYKPD